MKKILNSKDFQAWSGMIIGSLVYCIGIVFVLDLGKFYAGGVTGVAQIVTTLCEKGFNEGAVIVGLKSAIIVAINIPLFLIGWRGVSKRFAFVQGYICRQGAGSAPASGELFSAIAPPYGGCQTAFTDKFHQ